MIADEKQMIGPQGMSLEVVWRNPLVLVGVYLRAREASNPYYRWADQARDIRVRRSNWDARHTWGGMTISISLCGTRCQVQEAEVMRNRIMTRNQ